MPQVRLLILESDLCEIKTNPTHPLTDLSTQPLKPLLSQCGNIMKLHSNIFFVVVDLLEKYVSFNIIASSRVGLDHCYL